MVRLDIKNFLCFFYKMKIASIDVGIKNLAICIFDICGQEYIIDKWLVINLANDECCNVCPEIAKYSKDDTYYCMKHAKKSEYKIPNINLLTLEKKTKKELMELCAQHNMTLTDKALKCEILIDIKKRFGDDYLTQIERIKAHTINLIDIGKNIKYKLDKLGSVVDTVIIENQIGPIANRMKCIQAMITQYYIDAGVENIEYISAVNKLSHFSSGPSEYKDRKKLAVSITKTLICDTEWVKFFACHKKKDDLGDCFLQGLWYIQKNNNCGHT